MLISLIQEYKYVFLFIGLILGGETVLIPAVYLAYTSVLNWGAVLGITVLAAGLSDVLWYFLGSYLGKYKKDFSWVYGKREDFFIKISKLIDVHGLRVLVLSKFVYGTRIITQVLCGLRKVPFWRYTVINTLAIILWFLFIAVVVLFVGGSMDRIKSNITRVEVTLAILFGIIIIVHLWIAKIFKKMQ
jgi:membrane protein DedA with SNARE-associated domain